MTYFLLILSIFVWPFGQLLTFPIQGVGITIYLLDICTGLLALSMIFQKDLRKNISSDPLFKPFLFFIFVGLLSLVFNIKFLLSGSPAYSLLYFLRLLVYPSLYFSVKHLYSQKLLFAIVASFFLFCFFGLMQYVFLPDMRYLKFLGFDDHYFRLIGTFYDPNFTGAILSAVSLLLINLGYLYLSLPLIVLLALTFSRASYLVFAVGIIYFLFSKKKYHLLILLGFLILAVYLIPKPFGEGVNLGRTFSIFSRIDSWQTGLELYIKKPIFGWGYNTLRNITGDRFQIDNSFLFVAATMGITGLLAFLNLLKRIFTTINTPQKIFILALLFHALFNNSFFYIWINFAFWIVLGMKFKEYKQE